MRRARARRAAARKQARVVAGSSRFQLMLLGALRWIHDAPWRIAHSETPSLNRHAARALTRLERKLSRTAEHIDWTDAAQRHRLRIRVKRLRYACEPFAVLFVRGRTRRYLERLEALQDLLGDLNDVAVGRRLLNELASDSADAPVEFMRGWFVGREGELVGRLAGSWRAWRKTKRPW
jgi:triphosphatase